MPDDVTVTESEGARASGPRHNGPMTAGEDLLEERRRRRRAGDPRLTDEDKAILRRITSGDLAEEFQAALDADLEADPLLGGHDRPGEA
jgi:hypothetical protein